MSGLFDGLSYRCAYCGGLVLNIAWANCRPYHPECLSYASRPPVYTQQPLTEEDVRRIVREELMKIEEAEW